MNRLASLLAQGQTEEQKKLAVWNKGHPIPDYDAAVWRRDDLGSAIRYTDYGNRESEFGWEFDHYPIPAAMGGTDDVSNLRPLHWKHNARHGGLLSGLLENR